MERRRSTEASPTGATPTEILLDLAGELADLHDEREIAGAVARAVPGIVQADASAVLLVDHERQRLTVAGSWGWPDRMLAAVESFETTLDATPIIRAALEAPAPAYVTTDSDDALVAAVLSEYDTDAALVVPMAARGTVIGLVAAVARGHEPPPTDAATTERLQGLADQAAAAFDNARLVGELRRAEERYRAVSELTSDIAYSWVVDDDREGQLEWVAGSFERLTGYTTDEALAFRGWPAMIVPEDREAYERRVARLVRGESVRDDFRVRIRSGEIRWFRVYARPEHDEVTGRMRRVYGAIQDVTDRRRGEELHRAVSESMSDAAFSYTVVDAALELDWLVGGWERITGWPIPERPRRGLFSAIIHPDDAEVARGTESAVLRGERSVAELRTVTPGGDFRWLRIYATPVKDESGTVVRVFGAAQDVTDRRRAEEALRTSEAQLRGIFEASPLAIIALDAEGIVTLWNDAAEKIFGFSAEEALCRTLPIVPDDRWGEHEMLKARLRAGEHVDLFETKRRRKDGTLLDVTVSAAPLNLGGTGDPPGVIALLSDVGERKALERQVQQAEKMSALGRLAGGVAHDFNNLLTAIVGNVEFLVEDAADPDEVRENAAAIQAAAEQAVGLTEQMLVISRHQSPDVVVLDAHDVVASTARTLQRLVGEGIDFQIAVPAEPAWVRVARSQLEQVVLNLGLNARDAMPHGGILTVETTVGHRNGTLTLRVRDTGSGMDDDTRRQLFDPFFTTKPAGTGLGLAIVYGIVDSAGGTVSVQSQPGQGSTFEVVLPLQAGPPPGESDAATPAGGRRAGERVLLVEDEAAVRGLARRALERSGLDVVEAGSAEEALGLLAGAPPGIDLIVTDVVMPGIEGPELVQRVRATFPHVRVVFVSGYSDRLAEVPALAGGQAHFLAKPFTPSQLRDVVARALAEQPA